MCPKHLRSRWNSRQDVEHATAHHKHIGWLRTRCGLPLGRAGRRIIVQNAIIATGFRATVIDHCHVVAESGEPLGDVIQRDLASTNLPSVNAAGRKWEMVAGEKPHAHSRILPGMIA